MRLSLSAGKVVEAEDDQGRSIGIGQWIKRANGHWALRVGLPNETLAAAAGLVLLETANKLESVIGQRYGVSRDHPAMRLDYGRDMEVVHNARRVAYMLKFCT